MSDVLLIIYNSFKDDKRLEKLNVIGFVLLFVVTIMIVVALVVFDAWIWMLVLGALASVSGWACAFGFKTCFWLVVVLGLLAANFRDHSKNK